MAHLPNTRMALVGFAITALDQATKFFVRDYLGDQPYLREKIVIDGFFRLVHWGNTGAAWSLFHNNNELLTIVSLVALLVLFLNRRHFDAHLPLGQLSLGLIFGGIIGNLMDRINVGHVTDFLYFYVNRRNGSELGFPAFNVADSAICIGVGLLFILSWKKDSGDAAANPALPKSRALESGKAAP